MNNETDNDIVDQTPNALIQDEFIDIPWISPDPIKLAALEAAINGSTSNPIPSLVIETARIYEKYLREGTEIPTA